MCWNHFGISFTSYQKNKCFPNHHQKIKNNNRLCSMFIAWIGKKIKVLDWVFVFMVNSKSVGLFTLSILNAS